MAVSSNLQEKYSNLKEILRQMQSVMVAFSGGVDSTLLLKVARDVLGEKALAVTGDSATLARRELAEARRLVETLGAPHIVVAANELQCADFITNPPERCYHCKKTRFALFKKLQLEHGIAWIADGTNADDEGDWRPGIKAGLELGVRSPLKEAALNKSEIRTLSAKLGLPTWDKPSTACLASRVPYGDTITEEKLGQIALAEEFLNHLGFRQLRVRHHGELARIEIPKEDVDAALRHADAIVARLKEIGFHFVALDLSGFKSGSMNASLSGAALLDRVPSNLATGC